MRLHRSEDCTTGRSAGWPAAAGVGTVAASPPQSARPDAPSAGSLAAPALAASPRDSPAADRHALSGLCWGRPRLTQIMALGSWVGQQSGFARR
eukprot:scaffold1194_cov369-Prasinococcus_capsulatus_cf.AAC.5